MTRDPHEPHPEEPAADTAEQDLVPTEAIPVLPEDEAPEHVFPAAEAPVPAEESADEESAAEESAGDDGTEAPAAVLPGAQIESRSELRARRRRRMKRRRRTTIVVGLIVLLVGAGGVVALGTATDVVSSVMGTNDYSGDGAEGTETVVNVPQGSTITELANDLVERGVIKSSRPFIDEMENREVVLQARDYTFREGMSAAAAVDAIVDPVAADTLVVPEGLKMADIRTRMIEAGLPETEVAAALDDKVPGDYGLEVPGAPNLEGYLYPATYELRSDVTAESLVQRMVDRTADEIDDLGLAPGKIHEVFTLASLVQVESPGEYEVRRKVARVFLNRIDEGMKLQSDATVAYYAGARDDLTTTEEERAVDSPYNTYKYEGLPVGPVNSPGREAVDAAQDPADGNWLFFVATNPDTGETKFARTYEDHMDNVTEYREWLKQQT
ncbi:endolytic transglycosylase MltG [Brevibacterium litoralis]|uniref:endolytic transglycosylase MltG n=1 Tax=Brevibacterium litoralis TaxID=3138935 RepID=UPI003D9A820F